MFLKQTLEFKFWKMWKLVRHSFTDTKDTLYNKDNLKRTKMVLGTKTWKLINDGVWGNLEGLVRFQPKIVWERNSPRLTLLGTFEEASWTYYLFASTAP